MMWTIRDLKPFPSASGQSVAMQQLVSTRSGAMSCAEFDDALATLILANRVRKAEAMRRVHGA